ncbi:hypothetical protein [Streptomyces lavendulae]
MTDFKATIDTTALDRKSVVKLVEAALSALQEQSVTLQGMSELALGEPGGQHQPAIISRTRP